MKSYVDTLCEHFGVEKGEMFNIKGDETKYRVSDLTLEYLDYTEWKSLPQVKVNILWDKEIVVPFRAKNGEFFCYKTIDGSVCSWQWTGDTFEYLLLAIGNVFVNKEDAKSFDLKAKLQEMGVEI